MLANKMNTVTLHPVNKRLPKIFNATKYTTIIKKTKIY